MTREAQTAEKQGCFPAEWESGRNRRKNWRPGRTCASAVGCVLARTRGPCEAQDACVQARTLRHWNQGHRRRGRGGYR